VSDSSQASTVALSLVLCARNDRYMGDSLWRLRTALTYTARSVAKLRLENRVEVIVADWGSQKPLHEELWLDEATSSLVSFVVIPPAIALPLQGDSAFTEVVALNAAARRARGQFIGRIDQDTMVGTRFLSSFFRLQDGAAETPLDQTLLFSARRGVPYRFAVRSPSLSVVERFVRLRRGSLPVEGAVEPVPFYMGAVGIWLLHRALWDECRGYDERMIYMNGMEANMMQRLLKKYPIVDVGPMSDYDFFHLEHYHPRQRRATGSHRKVNPHHPFSEPDQLEANDEGWGLAAHSLEIAKARPASSAEASAERHGGWPATIVLMAIAAAEQLGDRAYLARGLWLRRVRIIREGVRGKPLTSWPRALRELWMNRQEARHEARGAGEPHAHAGAG
jgi:hypothetical protein